MFSKRFVLLAFAVLAIAAVAGCGSSSKKSEGASAATTAPATGDKAAFCADNATISAAVAKAQSADEALQAMKDNEALINSFASKAPAEIKADAQTQADAAKEVIKGDDSSKLNDYPPEAKAAGDKVDVFCGQSTPDTSGDTTSEGTTDTTMDATSETTAG